MIALLAALQWEVRPIRRRLDIQGREQPAGFAVTIGRCAGAEVLLCRSGMGRRAGEAAEVLLGRYPLEAILSVGLAGALSPPYAVGDLVLCLETQGLEAGGDRPSRPLASDERLLGQAEIAAQRCGLRSRAGGLLTVPRPVASPQEKELLRRTTGKDVIDMESYWVGQAARAQGIPFLPVRAISDAAHDRLLVIPGAVTPQGTRRLRPVLAHVARHPYHVGGLLGLAIASRRATANLALFLEPFLATLSPSLTKARV